MKYILLPLIITSFLQAKHLHPEKYYQNIACNKFKGVKEYTLQDKTRVDCLTKTYAIEVDFAPKWAESIGQSLYYGLMTSRKSGIILITENPQKDIKYIRRVMKVSKEHNITLWTMDSNGVLEKRF